MSFAKRFTVLAIAVALGIFGILGLTGCDKTAATFDGGKLTEEEVTTAAENIKSNNSDDWASYIANREWDASDDEEATDEETADEKATETEKAGDGTVAEFREYVIKELVKDKLVENEIEDRGIEVADSEVQTAYDQDAAMYEAYYGNGFAGTFESILENMGSSKTEYMEDLRKSLAIEKLEKEVTGIDPDADDADEDASDKMKEEYEKWLDELLEGSNLKIKDCPSDLSYDPANTEADSSSDDSTASDESADDSSEDSADDSADDTTYTVDEDGNLIDENGNVLEVEGDEATE